MPKRISQVPTATSLNSTDYFLIERNTIANYKVSLSFLETSIQTDLGLRTTDSPTFATVKCTNLTDGYIPYHVSDSNGLANAGVYWD
ncbi:MAG: hypothetical protein N2169_07720, partial [bacterium]|nr:hypothetical protein [bacterium]